MPNVFDQFDQPANVFDQFDQTPKDVGVLEALGAGTRRGVEQITGGAAQRLTEFMSESNQSALSEFSEKINSGEIPSTPENLEQFDRLSSLNQQFQSTLGGAEKREVQRREEFAPISEQQPVAAAIGQGFGQSLPLLATGGGGIPASLGGRMAVGAITGGAIGASQPTIEDEETNVLGSATMGAAIPLGLEKVAAPIAKAVSKPIASKVKQFLFKTQSPEKNKIVQLVEQNSDDAQRAGFTTETVGGVKKAVTDEAAEEVKRQGIDPGTVSLMQVASSADKKAMRNALDILKKGLKSKTFAVTNRPGDAAGGVLKSRYDAVKDINMKAAKEIKQAANKFKNQSADISGAYGSFLDEMYEAGVSIGRNKSGKLKGIYGDSEFALAGGTQKILNEFIAKSEKGQINALSAHRMKRLIDSAVEYGKKNTKDPILSKGESMLKTLRRGINEVLQEMSPAYKAANGKFSSTKQALDDFHGAAGPSFNPKSDNASKQLVNVARSLMSNNQKRVPALDAINALQESAKKFGTTFDDDILKQSAFMSELETMFGSSAPTSFGGQIEKSVSKAIRGDKAGIAAELIEGGIKKFKGINEEQLMKALEELLK